MIQGNSIESLFILTGIFGGCMSKETEMKSESQSYFCERWYGMGITVCILTTHFKKVIYIKI